MVQNSLQNFRWESGFLRGSMEPLLGTNGSKVPWSLKVLRGVDFRLRQFKPPEPPLSLWLRPCGELDKYLFCFCFFVCFVLFCLFVRLFVCFCLFSRGLCVTGCTTFLQNEFQMPEAYQIIQYVVL